MQLHIHPQNLFGGENFVLVNRSFNDMAWTITQNGKTIDG
jgi:hypothetical protein